MVTKFYLSSFRLILIKIIIIWCEVTIFCYFNTIYCKIPSLCLQTSVVPFLGAVGVSKGMAGGKDNYMEPIGSLSCANYNSND